MKERPNPTDKNEFKKFSGFNRDRYRQKRTKGWRFMVDLSESMKKILNVNEETDERLVEFVNRRRRMLDGVIGNIGHSFYGECDRELASILSNADPTTRDRFNYTVNNAFFIRNQDYCADYPLVSSLFLSLGSLRELINFVSHLPNDHEAAKGGIEARLPAQTVQKLRSF